MNEEEDRRIAAIDALKPLKAFKSRVDSLLGTLTPREREILAKRFGEKKEEDYK